VENRLDAFKVAHGIMYNYEWEETAITKEIICKGILEFIEEDKESNTNQD